VQLQATRLTSDLAERTGAQPIFLPAPGIVDTASVRRAMLKDRSVREAVTAWDSLTDVLVGIGSIEPSPLLVQSGNALPADDLAQLGRLGAVGDVCFRFFDERGVLVRSEIDQRVVGITPAQLLGVPRRIGVAGGRRKHAAIRAAIAGGWVNVLITDLDTARHLTQT
jgi:DNA-binding transcriptional regulator LsrR (DeoR family)